ncbi:hypothetical protein HP398_29790 [Brevibacillus sp. HB1.4B]|uniref:hypothetical protein n=1 Tax=Brevibacillus sp. HB1.4B TaxID=2738845 RepID=UPI00156B050E|nr:hypothetical protein [Brevibacillus sp. HB1.4B]NRS20615.1 hypothetical protein [Brevibacillus sp. HB1.4B]
MAADRLIVTVKSEFRLFRQPHKVGDVIRVREIDLLVIGIERFELWGSTLTIWYTCQDLSQTDFISKKNAYKQPRESVFEVILKHDSDLIKSVVLGVTQWHKGQLYKLVEYTDISLVGTDIRICCIGRPIHPVDRKEAKAKLFSDRRKKLQLEIL